MFFSAILFLLLVVAEESYSSECRTYYDKYDRLGLSSRNFLVGDPWPNNEVPYIFNPKFPTNKQEDVKRSMKEIEEKSCLIFTPYSGRGSYIYITDAGRGCYANLGFRSNRGAHLVNLGRGCERNGIVIHELLHALGFAHEHVRPDRDSYVQIKWENIEDGSKSSFYRNIKPGEYPVPPKCRSSTRNEDLDSCYSGFTSDTLGFAYDFGSVMHYGEYSFSKNWYRVMQPKVRTDKGIGQRFGMSSLDEEKLRAKYKCSGFVRTTSAPTTTTERPFRIICVDKVRNCFSNRDQCPDIKFRIKCRESCWACYGCEDKVSDCASKISECDSNSKVQEECALTCKLCEKK